MEAIPILCQEDNDCTIKLCNLSMGFSIDMPIDKDIKMKYKEAIKQRLIPPIGNIYPCYSLDIQYPKYKVNFCIYWASKSCNFEFRSNGSNIKVVLIIHEEFDRLIKIFTTIFA